MQDGMQVVLLSVVSRRGSPAGIVWKPGASFLAVVCQQGMQEKNRIAYAGKMLL